MAVPTTLVIDATQETLEITNSRDATALRGISIEAGPPTDGEGLFYQASSSEYVFRTVDESIDDRVAALLQSSSSGGLSWSYNDSAGTLTPVLALVNADIASGAAIAVSKLASSSVSYGGVSVTLGAADATPAFNLSDATAYPGDSSLVTTGTISSGTWQGSAIATSYTAAKVTSVVAGTLVDVSGTTGDVTVNVDLSELSTSTSDGDGDFFAVVDSSDAQKKLTKANIDISGFNDAVATSITGTGALNAGSITSGFGAIDVGSSAITGGAGSFTTISGSTSLALATGATVTGIDNGDLATGSATLLATQGAIKTYIDSSVTAQDLDVISDSGTIDIDLDSESLTLTGGTGIDTSATGTTVTYAIDSTVATLAGSQTLTNKTISGSSNTLSNIANGSLTNSTVSYGGISLSLGGSDATPAFDLADATNYGAGDLAGSTLASGVTASSLTSVGTLTELQVDNININLNTISSTAGTDLNITPLTGQQIVLDGTIVIDAGVVTGATSITSTAFVGNVTGDCSGSSSSTTGNAATATLASTVTVADSSDTTAFPAFFDSATGSLAIMTDASNLTYNAGTGVLSATGFAGPLTGNVTGDVSGSSGSTTGNAATATALATARTIGGTSFDGTANIVPATITVAATTDATCSVALFESATGDLAPKTDAGLTYNATSNVLAGTFNGDITGDVTGNVSGSAASLSATLAVASGGTNITSYTAGDILYASGSTTLAKLAKGSDTEVLTLASGVPSWSAPGAAAAGSLTGTTLASNVVTSSLTSTGTLTSLTVSGNATVGGNLTVGDAGAEDQKIVFDGNAEDYHIGIYDTNDDFYIGRGSTLGTTAALRIDGSQVVTCEYALSVQGGGGVVFNEDSANDCDFRVEGATDTHLFFVDGSAERVGIGTDTPLTKLTVYGDYITQYDGTIKTYYGSDGSGSLIGTNTNHYLRFISNDIERMKIEAAGDVYVSKNFVFGDTGGGESINIGATSRRIVYSDADLYLGDIDNIWAETRYRAGGTDTMVIDSNQRVGIGKSTDPASTQALKLGGTYPAVSGDANIGIFANHALTGTPNEDIIGTRLSPSFTEAGSGTHSNIVNLQVSPPSITGAGASLGTTSSLHITGASDAGASYNWALKVESGSVATPCQFITTTHTYAEFATTNGGGHALTIFRNYADNDHAWSTGRNADGTFMIGYNATTGGPDAVALAMNSNGDLGLGHDKKIYLDGVGMGGNTYIMSDTTDRFAVIAGGVTAFHVAESGSAPHGIEVKSYGNLVTAGIYEQSGSYTSQVTSDNEACATFGTSLTGHANNTGHLTGLYVNNEFTIPASTTVGLVAQARYNEPGINVSATGAAVTTAATLYVESAPTEGTNNYSLFIDSGFARFDGHILCGPNAGDAAAVGWGTTTYPLTVAFTGSSAQGAVWADKTTDDSSRYAIWFKRYPSSSWSTVGSITTGSGSTSYNTSSDYRLKENETPFGDALDLLGQLKPYTFNFKNDTETIKHGFFAHEAAEVVPQAVMGEKDEVDDDGEALMQGIDHSHMVPLLVAAVQELTEKVEELENG